MNLCTEDAKELAKIYNIGVHGPRDFYGARHKQDEEFVNYEWIPKK